MTHPKLRVRLALRTPPHSTLTTDRVRILRAEDPENGSRRGSALSAKQARFVAEYLIDLNATQAAIRAGYSRRAAEQQAYKNLRKPEIARAISAGKAKQLGAGGSLGRPRARGIPAPRVF